MKIQLDLKTLLIGLAAGVVITLALGADGAGSADAARFGIAVPTDGTALIKLDNGEFYIVGGRTAMATRVLYSNINALPNDRRDSKGQFFP